MHNGENAFEVLLYLTMQASHQKMRFLYRNGFILDTCHICMDTFIISLHRNVNNSKLILKNPLNLDQHPPLRNCQARNCIAMPTHCRPTGGSRGELRGLQPPPLNFQKRWVTSVAVVISTVSTVSEQERNGQDRRDVGKSYMENCKQSGLQWW